MICSIKQTPSNTERTKTNPSHTLPFLSINSKHTEPESNIRTGIWIYMFRT